MADNQAKEWITKEEAVRILQDLIIQINKLSQSLPPELSENELVTKAIYSCFPNAIRELETAESFLTPSDRNPERDETLGEG